MKVFISWSGKRSHAMALALKDWLPLVLQAVEPWVSSEDLRSGGRWALELSTELDGAKFGIACLTSDNLDSKWLHFEAGAISKQVGEGFLAPLLLDITPSDVSQPLGAFQAVEATNVRVLKLLKDIRDTGKLGVTDQVIERLHANMWPELEAQLLGIDSAETSHDEPVGRDDRALLEEILDVVRGLAARNSAAEEALGSPSLAHLLNRLRHGEPVRPTQGQATLKELALRQAHRATLAESLPALMEEMEDERSIFVHAHPTLLDPQHIDALDEYAQRYGMSINYVLPKKQD